MTALVGVAVPERTVNGTPHPVEADDNAQVLLDFGERVRHHHDRVHDAEVPSPAIEVYGSEGTIQLLGDDWAPEGWSCGGRRMARGDSPGERPQLAVDRGAPPPRRLHRDGPLGRSRDPSMPTTRSRSSSPRRAAGRDGVARSIGSVFPRPVYKHERGEEAEADRHAHDRRSHDGL